jgi:hypothetical protein
METAMRFGNHSRLNAIVTDRRVRKREDGLTTEC